MEGPLEDGALGPAAGQLAGDTCVRAWGGQCGGTCEGTRLKKVTQEGGGRIRDRCFQENFQKTERKKDKNHERQDHGCVVPQGAHIVRPQGPLGRNTVSVVCVKLRWLNVAQHRVGALV